MRSFQERYSLKHEEMISINHMSCKMTLKKLQLGTGLSYFCYANDVVILQIHRQVNKSLCICWKNVHSKLSGNRSRMNVMLVKTQTTYKPCMLYNIYSLETIETSNILVLRFPPIIDGINR